MDTQHTATHPADLGFAHVFEPGTTGWTLLLLHGTGGDEHDLVAVGRQLAPGAALLSPRGKVSEGGALRFFRRLAVGRLDIPDLLARTDELAGFVRAAAGAYGFDAGRVIALGFSNGANIAASLLLRRPEVLRGAALLRPMLPYEPEEVPQLRGTDVLVAAGEGDPYSSAEQTLRLAEVLREGGAEVTVHTADGAGHSLTRDDLVERELRAWRGMLEVHAAVTQQLDADMRGEHGLPLSSYEVLMFLADADGHRMRMADIAERALVSRSGLTRLIDRLAGLGFVERSSCPEDGRGAYAELTEAGLRKLEAARRTHLEGVRRLFLDRLSAGDQRALADAWNRIRPENRDGAPLSGSRGC